MDTPELLQLLWRMTLVATGALAALLVLPRWLRGRFGADVAYAAWWLLPVSLVALAVPARTVLPASPTTPAPALHALVQPVLVAPTQAADRSTWWLLAWLAGALLTAAWLWRAQRRFERGLGALAPCDDGLWRAQARAGLPALVGALRPRIVLPDDFEHRYDARERGLMLAHERLHRRRGDHLANLAAATFRCVFWFHPLLPLATARFRHDQELACDRAVVAAHPDSRRAYGEAMLKTLMADRQAPLGCHWGVSHPLKERVMHLVTPPPRPRVRRFGAALVATLLFGTGFAVWSAQPARSASAAVAPTDRVSATGAGESGIRFDIEVSRDGRLLGSPSVWVPFGQPAVVEVGENVRIVAQAEVPRGDTAWVTATFYRWTKDGWAPDVAEFDKGTMAMPAKIDRTPSFQRTMDGDHLQVEVRPRRAMQPPAPPRVRAQQLWDIRDKGKLAGIFRNFPGQSGTCEPVAQAASARAGFDKTGRKAPEAQQV